MTAVLQWIDLHGAEAPPRLAARVREVLDADPRVAGLAVPEAMLRAGETLLAAVLAEGAPTGPARDRALDLLAADACVTWAFEAAADEPGTLPARAENAMRRIAEVAR